MGEELHTITRTSSTTGTKLAIATLALAIAGGLAFAAIPMAKKYKKSRTTPITTVCKESDSGLDALVRGTTKGQSRTGRHIRATDRCATSGNLIEYYCVDNAVNVKNTVCDEGYSCTDGACVAEATETCLEGDVTDGTYPVCPGGRLTHTPSNMGIVYESRIDEDTVNIAIENILRMGDSTSVFGTHVSGIFTEFNNKVVVAGNSGEVIELILQRGDGDQITLTIITTTDEKRGDSTLSEGNAEIYVGDTIINEDTGISLTPRFYREGSRDIEYIIRNAKYVTGGSMLNDSIRQYTDTSLDAQAIEFGYIDLSTEDIVHFNVSTRLLDMACGDTGGGDGLYSACIGDSYTHHPSGIRMYLVHSNGSLGNFSFENATTRGGQVRYERPMLVHSLDGLWTVEITSEGTLPTSGLGFTVTGTSTTH